MEIIKDRPLHTSAKRASWKDYPFATLQTGESFYLKPGEFERKKFSVMLHSVGVRLSKSTGSTVKFSTKSENGGLWVQRIS